PTIRREVPHEFRPVASLRILAGPPPTSAGTPRGENCLPRSYLPDTLAFIAVRLPSGCRPMLKRVTLLAAVAGAFVLALYAAADKPAPKEKPIPEMKFNDVVELAPGVFFRYSSISASDKTIPFG